jgi:hypothetical protein
LHWIFAALCVRANQSSLCIWRSHHFEFVTINHYIALGVRTHVVIGVRINKHYIALGLSNTLNSNQPTWGIRTNVVIGVRINQHYIALGFSSTLSYNQPA